MATSALAGVFREFACTYEQATGEWGTDPDTGNPIPEVIPRTLVINFKASTAPQLVWMDGADPKVIKGKGTCVDPSRLPSGLGPGSELAITWDGHPGTLRITQSDLAELEVLDDILGQEFLGEIHLGGAGA